MTTLFPNTWNGQTFSALDSDAVEFQLTGLTGVGPWIPQRSLNGTNWDPCIVYDQQNTPYSSLTSDQAGKCLSADGRGYFRLFSATGTDTVSGIIRAS